MRTKTAAPDTTNPNLDFRTQTPEFRAAHIARLRAFDTKRASQMVKVSVSGSPSFTMTDRTPAGYGPIGE